MSSRKALAAAVCALTLSLPVTAQIEDSGLDLVNPWGLGFLEAGEPSLPTDMWRASNAEDLLPMMRSVRTHSLTPAERALMRRMALSPANPPAGEQEPLLRAERARIMFELGEAKAAAALMARLDEPPPGMESDEVSADLNLALGNEATSCAMLTDPDRSGAYWAKLRAVCAALKGNTAGAELAIEIALNKGVDDSWLLNAVFAASGELPDPPLARYDSGLALAISAAAGLAPPEQPLAKDRPDLASAMAARSDLPPAVRVEAAGLAAQSGLMAHADYRAAFNALLADPDFTPTTSLEVAISSARDPLKTDAERSHALATALEAAMGSPAGFSAAARLLRDDLAETPLTAETAGDALIFAKAGIAAGDPKAAALWTDASTVEGAPEIDSFDMALIGGLVILSGADTSRASLDFIAGRLVEEAKSKKQKRAATRLMALWTAVGIATPAEARRLMMTEGEAAFGSTRPAALLALLSAAESGAAGEVILSTVGMTNGDPTKLDPADLTIIILALKRIDAEDEARQLALEATGYWKASE